jgi:hypothetical protein
VCDGRAGPGGGAWFRFMGREPGTEPAESGCGSGFESAPFCSGQCSGAVWAWAAALATRTVLNNRSRGRVWFLVASRGRGVSWGPMNVAMPMAIRATPPRGVWWVFAWARWAFGSRSPVLWRRGGVVITGSGRYPFTVRYGLDVLGSGKGGTSREGRMGAGATEFTVLRDPGE